MSSEEFEKLHEMFQSQFDEVKMMSGRALTSQGEEKKRSIRVFEKQLDEAEEMLQGMESELFGAPASFRTPMTTKIRIYRRDLAKLQRDVRSSAAFGASDLHSRSGLYAAQNEQSTQLQSQRALLIQGTESLKNATKSIERSHQIAAETDQIGTDIIEELGEQREQLDRTRGRLVNTGENLTRSRKILRAMSRRLVTNKLLLSVIIIMELAILGAVVYLKFFRKT